MVKYCIKIELYHKISTFFCFYKVIVLSNVFKRNTFCPDFVSHSASVMSELCIIKKITKKTGYSFHTKGRWDIKSYKASNQTDQQSTSTVSISCIYYLLHLFNKLFTFILRLDVETVCQSITVLEGWWRPDERAQGKSRHIYNNEHVYTCAHTHAHTPQHNVPAKQVNTRRKKCTMKKVTKDETWPQCRTWRCD